MQCAKKTLKSLLQNRIVAKEALRTALVEADGVLNSRPVTHVSNDTGDIEALTPNHFLLPGENPSNEEAEVSERDQRNEIMATVSSACQHFIWKRLTKEHMPSLTEGKKWREEKESEGRRRSACCRTEPATRNVAFG